MDTNVILAIDLGRYNSVLYWYSQATHAADYRTVHSTPEELRQALTQRPVSSVVFEACSQAGWVHDLCEASGLPMTVASPSGEAWQRKRVTKKTDRDDALKLARLEAMGEVDPMAIPDRKTRQRKSLIGLRKRLVSERVRTQNRIRAVLVGQGLRAPRGFSAWTTAGLNGLAAAAGQRTVQEEGARRAGPKTARSAWAILRTGKPWCATPAAVA